MNKKRITSLIILFCISFASLSAQDLRQANSEGDFKIKEFKIEKGMLLQDIVPLEKIKSVQTDINPGDAIEGDYLRKSVYTKDGNKILVVNGMTNNVTVFDANTFSIINNINVGQRPYDIAITNDYAIISCIFEDQIDIIDLATMTVSNSFSVPAGSQPATVKVSNDGNFAYIACDINNRLERIDLDNMQQLTPFTDFPISLISFSSSVLTNRYSFNFSNFEISQDGQYIIVSDADDSLDFINTTTGVTDYSISGLIPCYTIGFSGDYSKIIAAGTDWGKGNIKIYQIDITSHSLISELDITGYTISTLQTAVNQDGSKAYFAISGNSSALVNFSTSNIKFFTSTHSPHWIEPTHDHLYAISGQYYFSIIDFENENVIGTNFGRYQDVGCASPTDYKVAAYDPLRFEGVLFYSFSDPTNVILEGEKFSGSETEGDAPYRIAISADGSKIISTNDLSNSATIIDGETYAVDAIINTEESASAVAISPDGNTAVLGGYDLNTIKIIDLNTLQIVKTVYTGQRPMMVEISEDNNYAYIGNLKENSVSIVKLEGASSYLVGTINTGVIGLTFAGKGSRSSVRVDPTGQYILVAASFNDKVQIIDINSLNIIKEIPTGDFPLKVEFNTTGDTAIVLNYYDNTFTAIHLNGSSSSALGTFSTGGDSPIRVEYNEVNSSFGIVNYYGKNLVEVNSSDWNNTHIIESYNSYGSPSQVHYDEKGIPMVLVIGDDEPGYLIKNGNAVTLPAIPSYFDYCTSESKAVICMPGPDYISVVDYNIPTANFDSDQTTVYENETVSFNDLSLGSPTSWNWSFEGGSPSVSTEQNPSITYNTAGQYNVNLYVENEDGTDNILKEDYINVLTNISVDDIFNRFGIKMFPNPFKNNINVRSSNENFNDFQVTIYNSQGKMIKSLNANKSNFVIPTNSFSSGIYYIKIRMNNKIEIIKFVKE